MYANNFTDNEFQQFKARFDRTPGWRHWQRRTGENGEDVLEIMIGIDQPVTLKIAKSPRSGFLATGYDGWGLMVAEDFDELLQVLASMNPAQKAARNPSWPVGNAAPEVRVHSHSS